jgi:hypothetical protein
MKIDQVLAPYIQDQPELGGRPNFDVERFRADLDRVRLNSARMFWIWVGAVLVIFTLALLIFVLWVRTPWQAAGVLAAAGVSIPNLIRQLQTAWEQKVQADTLLAFAGTLDPAIMNSIVRAFLRRFTAMPNARSASNPQSQNVRSR